MYNVRTTAFFGGTRSRGRRAAPPDAATWHPAAFELREGSILYRFTPCKATTQLWVALDVKPAHGEPFGLFNARLTAAKKAQKAAGRR